MCLYTLNDEEPRPESMLDGDFSVETTETYDERNSSQGGIPDK